jgi:hypothetical protein
MHSLLVRFTDDADRDQLLAMNGGDRFDTELMDDERVRIIFPRAQSADAARAIAQTLRDQLGLDGDRMILGESEEI